MSYYDRLNDNSYQAPDRPNGLVIGVTGHRPHKLWGYDLDDPKYQNVAKALEGLANQLGARGIITGMALGFDQLCADVAIRNRDIRSIAAIPFEGQAQRWPMESQMAYRQQLRQMDERVVVSDGDYSPEKMYVRNQWIVDHADVMVALWDGTSGGTGHCVHSAEMANRPIFRLDPNDVTPYSVPTFEPYNDQARTLLAEASKPVGIRPDINGLPVVTGDLALAHDCVIVHQVNCQDVVDDAVSGPLFSRWPSLNDHYHSLAQGVPQPEARHGLVTEVDVEPDVTVCLVYSQLDYDGFRVMSDRDVDKLVNGVQAVTRMHPDKAVCLSEGLGGDRTDMQWDTVGKRLAKLPVCAVRHEHDVVPKLPTRQTLEQHIREEQLRADTLAREPEREPITVPGDIALAEGCVIAHQVNCQDRIGAGVSGAITKRWPVVERRYHEFAQQHPTPQDRLGRIQPIPVGNGTYVCNLFTQLNYGNSSKTGTVYTDVDKLVRRLENLCERRPDDVICVPENIGCGLAGADWDDVRRQIAHLPICVISYEPGRIPELPTRKELDEHLRPQTTEKVTVSYDDSVDNPDDLIPNIEI
jgi:uncharacterized phage-like protein YoqJ/O-acetyl-ADP-ribose deacetylase (regulator of RNase III)